MWFGRILGSWVFLTLTKSASFYFKAKGTASSFIDVPEISYKYWGMCEEVTYDLRSLALNAQNKQKWNAYIFFNVNFENWYEN